MRTYQPIWLLLRQHKEVKLKADPVFHHTIVRMVSKEKNEDKIFKAGLRKSGRRAWLEVLRNGDVIIFKLKFSISLVDMGFMQYKDETGKWKLDAGLPSHIKIMELGEDNGAS